MGYVYILRQGDDDFFKIGRTKNPIEERIKTLSTGNSETLSLFDHIATDFESTLEHYLHQCLYSYHHKQPHAKEFYHITPDELCPIIQAAKQFQTQYAQAFYKAQEAKDQAPLDTLQPLDETSLQLCHELGHLKASMGVLQHQKILLENQLKGIIASHSGIEDLVSFKAITQKRINTQRLKEKYPEIYEELQEESITRVFKLL